MPSWLLHLWIVYVPRIGIPTPWFVDIIDRMLSCSHFTGDLSNAIMATSPVDCVCATDWYSHTLIRPDIIDRMLSCSHFTGDLSNAIMATSPVDCVDITDWYSHTLIRPDIIDRVLSCSHFTGDFSNAIMATSPVDCVDVTDWYSHTLIRWHYRQGVVMQSLYRRFVQCHHGYFTSGLCMCHGLVFPHPDSLTL